MAEEVEITDQIIENNLTYKYNNCKKAGVFTPAFFAYNDYFFNSFSNIKSYCY